jgi:hypothetical protein
MASVARFRIEALREVDRIPMRESRELSCRPGEETSLSAKRR